MNKLLSGLIIGTSLLSSNLACAIEDGQKYDDWRVQCITSKDNRQNCHIFQDLLEKETKQRVLHIAVGNLPGHKTSAAIITLPLGISLPPGIAFRVDTNEARVMPLQACFSNGCQAAFKLETKILTELKKGAAAEVIFYNMSNQAISIPVSLKGFTAAINAIGD